MRDYAFDIETMPNTSMLALLPEPEVSVGNLKDADKIAEKIAKAKEKQIADMALSPLTGRVCCAVFGNDDGAEGKTIAAENDEQEVELIEWIMEPLEEYRLVTWNGINFDLPFVYKRAMILGIDPRCFGAPLLSTWTKRYSTERHVDLMQVWGNWNSQSYARLNDVARMVLGKVKIEIDFKDFPELIKTPEGRARLQGYCEGDALELTWGLYQNFLGVLL